MSLWKGKSFDIYNNSSDPSAPDTGYVSLYFKNNFPYWKTSGNKTYRILDDTTAISARPSLTSAIASADELLIDDAGTLKRTSISNLQSYMQNNLSFSSGGYTFTWNGYTINDGNVTNNVAGNGLTTTNTSDTPGVYDSIIKLHELNTEATQASDFDYMAVIDSSWNWKYMTKANLNNIFGGVSQLNDLSDVTIGGAGAGYLLEQDGNGDWSNVAKSTINLSEFNNDLSFPNYYLNGITKSSNTLTFSVNGTTNQTYTFGDLAFKDESTLNLIDLDKTVFYLDGDGISDSILAEEISGGEYVDQTGTDFPASYLSVMHFGVHSGNGKAFQIAANYSDSINDTQHEVNSPLYMRASYNNGGGVNSYWKEWGRVVMENPSTGDVGVDRNLICDDVIIR